MTAAMPISPSSTQGFEQQFEQCAEEAAFLWLLRSMVVKQPHYLPRDVQDLERRIDAQIAALQIYPEEGWSACQQALSFAQPGEVFAASVLAFRSLEVGKIQTAIEVGLTTEANLKAVVSAMAWLPGRFCHDWIKRFFTSKDFGHKRLALAACAARGEDPCGYLTRLLERDDCRSEVPLYAEGLKLAGNFKRRDLLPFLVEAVQSEEPSVAFYARRAACLLGDPSAPQQLSSFACEPNPYQREALLLAVRALPPTEAKRWITQVLREQGQTRLAVEALAALGDPEAMPWLLEQMREPQLARVAGEAFHQITGVDLEEHDLHHRFPSMDELYPSDDPDDDRVELDNDENLPWPNSEKVRALWQQLKHRFAPNTRYFLGQAITLERLQQVEQEGLQRHRLAAALEWALREPGQPLPNPKRKLEPIQ